MPVISAILGPRSNPSLCVMFQKFLITDATSRYRTRYVSDPPRRWQGVYGIRRGASSFAPQTALAPGLRAGGCFGTYAAVSAGSPILIVPYMWIGDFVRCHTVIRLLRVRCPDRPIDMLTTTMVAPLIDYMPGVRKGIVFDLPRKRIALSQHRALADLLRRENYGDALIMPRTWKSALAPFFAGIPRRTGFVGEMRFGLVNDLRDGEKALPRMVDRCPGAAQGRRLAAEFAAAATCRAARCGAEMAHANEPS